MMEPHGWMCFVVNTSLPMMIGIPREEYTSQSPSEPGWFVFCQWHGDHHFTFYRQDYIHAFWCLNVTKYSLNQARKHFYESGGNGLRTRLRKGPTWLCLQRGLWVQFWWSLAESIMGGRNVWYLPWSVQVLSFVREIKPISVGSVNSLLLLETLLCVGLELGS